MEIVYITNCNNLSMNIIRAFYSFVQSYMNMHGFSPVQLFFLEFLQSIFAWTYVQGFPYTVDNKVYIFVSILDILLKGLCHTSFKNINYFVPVYCRIDKQMQIVNCFTIWICILYLRSFSYFHK